MADDLTKEASRIADAIVVLVKDADGYVTLSEVERKITGFAARSDPSWSFVNENQGETMLFWTGMTRAGLEALRNVLDEHRVAFQVVSQLPYILEGSGLPHDDWTPIVLLPVEAANVVSPKGLMRFAPNYLQHVIQLVGWRELRPEYVNCAADAFPS